MTETKNVPKSLANNRLDKVAASLFPNFSRTQIKKWILEGRILINGDLSKPKDMTQENDGVAAFTQTATISSRQGEDAALMMS